MHTVPDSKFSVPTMLKMQKDFLKYVVVISHNCADMTEAVNASNPINNFYCLAKDVSYQILPL